MIRILIFSLLAMLSCQSTKSQTNQITFKVAIDRSDINKKISLRGSIPPLSWDKDYPMTDTNGDGIYETTITFNTDRSNVKYEFQVDGSSELAGSDSRKLWFKSKPITVEHLFNEYEYYNDEKLASLTLTPEQIKGDIAILKKTLAYIHPNLNGYRSEEDLEKDYQVLEAEMLATPTVTNAYKAISKFATNIQCSHTFTNPWNQGTMIKQAIFNQPDKAPFTFSRIGKQLFITKNASEDDRLKRGLEIVKINGVNATDILTQLANYITSDGANYEKRLERLLLSGDEKYALFDIFYSLEYGKQDSFLLDLKDHSTNNTLSSKVSAMSKTKRSKILNDRYDDSVKSFEDQWSFNMISEKIAHLKINSFAVQEKNFEWKNYLDDVFVQLNTKRIEHFIIDIRDNEGGQGEVGQYITQRILTKPIKVEAAKLQTTYRKIPDDLRTNISTWEKAPYNWRLKVKKIKDGRYQLRQLFAGGYKAKTYQPMNDGFKGKSYLLTGPQNSSATHIMATYVKKYKLATIIGQTTGGNQRGVNGNHFFFLKLPNSKVEVDIPIFKTTMQEVTSSTPNGGIIPDVIVTKNILDLINGVDTELEATLEHIENQIN